MLRVMVGGGRRCCYVLLWLTGGRDVLHCQCLSVRETLQCLGAESHSRRFNVPSDQLSGIVLQWNSCLCSKLEYLARS